MRRDHATTAQSRLAKERRLYEEEQKLLSRPGELVLKSLADEVRAAAAEAGVSSASGEASGDASDSKGQEAQ